MMQKEVAKSRLHAGVGEHIGFELGAKMVKDFQDTYPTENKCTYVGRNIIENILAQPGCVGIKMFNALNENGEKTLVFVGLNEAGRHILEYNVIDNQGSLIKKEGIVADRIVIRPKDPNGDEDKQPEPDTLGWW